MLDDGDAGAEERGVNGTGPVVRRIDVERIDPDQSDAGVHQLAGEPAGQMRMALKILIGAPVRVPTGVKEDCFSI